MPRRTGVTIQQRQFVTERAQGCCEYCMSLADFATESFSVEHIIPLAEGGDHALANLALACQGCNGHKYTKIAAFDPLDNIPVALYHPRKQRWHEHFSWSRDYTHIIGITPTGRATVEALKMNRPNLINLRMALYLLGEHPPGYQQA